MPELDERARLSCWLGAPTGEPLSRGEALLWKGDLHGALSALEEELGREPKEPWLYLSRAAVRFRLGNAEAASADVAEFRRLRPDAGSGPAVDALLAAARGDSNAALAAADEAVSLAWGASWALGLRGVLRGRLGLLHDAKADLDAALEKESEPWALAARADVLDRIGLYADALKDLERLRQALPGDPEPDVLAAAIHRDQAQFKQGILKLTRAEALSPKDPRFARLKAEIRFLEGKPAQAAAELGRALKLTPEDRSLRFERLRLLLLGGKEKQVEQELKEAGLSAPQNDFLKGYSRARQGKWKEAEALFTKTAASNLPEADHLREKATLYRRVAKEMPHLKPPKKLGPREFRMAGLGYRQPFQTTVEALRWMSTCDVLFSNLSDPAVVDFVGLFGVPFRAIVFRREDQQAVRCAKDVMPAFRTHKVVGVVTRGHPLFYGRLAWRLAVLSQRRGYSVRVPGSTSIADTISALAGGVGAAQGVEIRDADSLSSTDPRLPLMIYNLASMEDGRAALAARLSTMFPPSHPAWLLAGMGEREFDPVPTTVAELPEALARADEATTLLLPASV